MTSRSAAKTASADGGRARITALTTLPGGRAHESVGTGPSRSALLWGRRRVLLLNATYEPLTAISLRRAIVLVLRERADVVHADDGGLAVHSADMSVPVPSVIRLRSFVKVPYRAVVPLTRAALMHRDRFRCGYCSAKATTIDHVLPRSRGGAHSWENCVACCASCNHRKADRLLSELGWSLRVQPGVPKGRHWRLLATVKEIDPAWAQYIDAGAA
ncbi:HNH endonuclease [Gordonia hankookensis]|uniref:HNH endonuclease n=1 Tax=Gordonia hankookensis TaxID=589403 RepID=A0ABR7WGM7_9ACTN|nr:HNH endonuclease [Gordonia hankookensis]MBD1321613.1 HNH endonuclease [Gordonia hankookensis]NDZ93209.1 HNH endonuclease [Streptomyces sp. SID11726]NDZ94806.1 HNH endonuclease [Streptomyces sp. SID11726]NEB22966.1 HNH endonuclease [Streptomyces sp. SID6673]